MAVAVLCCRICSSQPAAHDQTARDRVTDCCALLSITKCCLLHMAAHPPTHPPTHRQASPPIPPSSRRTACPATSPACGTSRARWAGDGRSVPAGTKQLLAGSGAGCTPTCFSARPPCPSSLPCLVAPTLIPFSRFGAGLYPGYGGAAAAGVGHHRRGTVLVRPGWVGRACVCVRGGRRGGGGSWRRAESGWLPSLRRRLGVRPLLCASHPTLSVPHAAAPATPSPTTLTLNPPHPTPPPTPHPPHPPPPPPHPHTHRPHGP